MGVDPEHPSCVEASQPDPDWNEAFARGVFRAALDHARGRFEATTWRAFERVWLDGRPAGEVAGEFGLPIEKVYAAKSRVLKRLEEEVRLLAEDFPVPAP